MNEREAIGADFRYVSNENSLVSLAQNECDLAGMHLPQGGLRDRSIEASRVWLKPQVHRAISFVTREMGLMVCKGNPLGITGLADLIGEGVRFVNRDPDSGTRLLLELMLAEAGLDPAAINGYAHGEYTHAAAVAAYAASGMADVAFGVEAAVRQFDLDFVRLLTEDYFFVCRRETLELEARSRRCSRSCAARRSGARSPPCRATASATRARSGPSGRSSSASTDAPAGPVATPVAGPDSPNRPGGTPGSASDRAPGPSGAKFIAKACPGRTIRKGISGRANG